MSGIGVKTSTDSLDREIEAGTRAERQLEAARGRPVEILRLLWDRRRLLLHATAMGLFVSAVIAFRIPKSYTSTTQLMPPDEKSMSGMAMMAGLAAKAGGDLGSVAEDFIGLRSSGALFIGVLRSQTSEQRIVNQFDLKKVYRIKLMSDARKKLDENTSISEDRKSGIISISVIDHSPQRAAAIANAYVDELNSLVSQLATSAAHRERVFLEERLKVAQHDLDDASSQLAQFSSQNNTLDIQTEGKTMLEAAARVTGELIAAQAEVGGLRQIYTDHSPRVRALNGRIAELRKQLEKLGGIERNGADTAAAEAVQTADPAQGQVKSASMPFPTIRNLPFLGARYSDYYRRAKTQETVNELLTAQYELAKVEEAKETPSIKVLDPAQVPERKSFPPRLLIMFLGTFWTLSISVVWLLGTKRWQDADPCDPCKMFVREVLATVKVRTPWSARNGSRAESEEKTFGTG